MASDLRAEVVGLDGGVRSLGQGWLGAAADAFQGRWHETARSMTEAAANFDQVAAKLDEVAAQIEETNHQVHALYVAIGVTVAVGLAVSLVTVGFGSAGAAAAASAQAQQAATIVARLGTFLTISVRTMSGFRAALVVFGQRWAIAAAGNVLTTASQKAVFGPNHNPLEGWSLPDLTKIIVSSTTSAALGTAAANSARWSPTASTHPWATNFGTGFVANGTASVVNDLGVDRLSLSPATAGNVLVNGLAGGSSSVSTVAAGRLVGARQTPSGLLYVPGHVAPNRLVVPRSRPSLWVPRTLDRTVLTRLEPPLRVRSTETLVGVPVDAFVQVGVPAAFPDRRR
jgi:WXG100 family type VII secretion target